jgi:hypothetical protein
MTKQGWLVAGTWIVFCLAPAGLAAADQPAARWLTDYDKARAEARASGKPIFLVFRCEH